MYKILSNPITVIILSILSLVIFFSLRHRADKISSSYENVNILEQEINTISSEIINEQSQLDNVRHSLSKEKILRNELLMQKEGEYVVQLPEITPIPVQENKGEVLEPWEAWKRLLFR